MKNKIYLYYIIAIIPPFMGALSNIISKYCVGEISPISLLFYRWVIAITAFTPFAIKGFIKDFERIKSVIGIVFIIALSGITLFNLLVYYAMHYTSSTSASIVISMFSLFVMLLGICINKDILQPTQVLSIMLSLIGGIVIVSKGNIISELANLFNNYGDFLALIATLIYAIYTFAFKFKPSDISLYSFSYATFLLGAIMILPIYLFDVFYLDHKFEINIQNISALLCLGVAVSVVGMLIFNVTIIKLGYNLASIIFYLMPAFTAIMATTFLDEKIEYFHYIGMSLILIGVNLPIVIKLKKRR